MKRIYFIIIFSIFSCAAPTSKELPVDGSSAINKIMANQEEAWNSGDIETFMVGYWESDSLKFIGSRGITYGFENTLVNYKKTYPDKETMGKLKFDILNSKSLGDSFHHVIGKWTLFRESDTLSGHYTLLWEKISDSWKIISDHSS